MTTEETPKTRRGDATRAKILSAARERFAADGYERATIRAIATEAGIDPALVMRYYGSKAGLFASAVEFDLCMPDLAAVEAESVGTVLVEHFFGRWEGDDNLKALLRAAATTDAAAERMRSIFMKQAAPVIAAVCPDPKSAATRAGLISAQLLGFALCRYVLKIPPVVAMRRADVVSWLGPTVHRYICGTKVP